MNVPPSQSINFIAIFQSLWLWKTVYRNRDNDYNLFQKLFEKWDVFKVSSHVERNWFLQITLELLEGILTANFKNSDAGKLLRLSRCLNNGFQMLSSWSRSNFHGTFILAICSLEPGCLFSFILQKQWFYLELPNIRQLLFHLYKRKSHIFI